MYIGKHQICYWTLGVLHEKHCVLQTLFLVIKRKNIFILFYFYLDKFDKNGSRADEKECLIEELQTWKLNYCISNAASLDPTTKTKITKNCTIATVEYLRKNLTKMSSIKQAFKSDLPVHKSI